MSTGFSAQRSALAVRRIVVLSNGHGEDAIGAVLGRELTTLGFDVSALPLVGKGDAYELQGFQVLGPRREMPSGGMVHLNPKMFWRDLQAGWLSMSLAQWKALRQAAKNAAATLVVGDLYALLAANLFGGRPLFQVQPLVSVRYQNGLGLLDELPRITVNRFVLPERLLMRKAAGVYLRDRESAEWLNKHGVPQARYLGNPLMDAASGTAALDLPAPYLLLLPGSREDAYFSLPVMLEALRQLRDYPLTPVIAWAREPVVNLGLSGWQLTPTGQTAGVTHLIEHLDGTRAYLAQHAFKTALENSKLALSTSGTAAEQAAGHGIPLISFPTPGPQYTPAFAKAQKRLLQNALTLTSAEPATIAGTVHQLMTIHNLYHDAQKAGRELIGKPGAVGRIAQDIANHLTKN